MSKEIAAPVVSSTVTNIHTITAQIISTKNTVGRILAMAYMIPQKKTIGSTPKL